MNLEFTFYFYFTEVAHAGKVMSASDRHEKLFFKKLSYRWWYELIDGWPFHLWVVTHDENKLVEIPVSHICIVLLIRCVFVLLFIVILSFFFVCHSSIKIHGQQSEWNEEQERNKTRRRVKIWKNANERRSSERQQRRTCS